MCEDSSPWHPVACFSQLDGTIDGDE